MKLRKIRIFLDRLIFSQAYIILTLKLHLHHFQRSLYYSLNLYKCYILNSLPFFLVPALLIHLHSHLSLLFNYLPCVHFKSQVLSYKVDLQISTLLLFILLFNHIARCLSQFSLNCYYYD